MPLSCPPCVMCSSSRRRRTFLPCSESALYAGLSIISRPYQTNCPLILFLRFVPCFSPRRHLVMPLISLTQRQNGPLKGRYFAVDELLCDVPFVQRMKLDFQLMGEVALCALWPHAAYDVGRGGAGLKPPGARTERELRLPS